MIVIINDVNIVSRIKIFAGRDKSAKTVKILPRKTFWLYGIPMAGQSHKMDHIQYINAPEMWVCYVRKEFARSHPHRMSEEC